MHAGTGRGGSNGSRLLIEKAGRQAGWQPSRLYKLTEFRGRDVKRNSPRNTIDPMFRNMFTTGEYHKVEFLEYVLRGLSIGIGNNRCTFLKYQYYTKVHIFIVI